HVLVADLSVEEQPAELGAEPCVDRLALRFRGDALPLRRRDRLDGGFWFELAAGIALAGLRRSAFLSPDPTQLTGKRLVRRPLRHLDRGAGGTGKGAARRQHRGARGAPLHHGYRVAVSGVLTADQGPAAPTELDQVTEARACALNPVGD